MAISSARSNWTVGQPTAVHRADSPCRAVRVRVLCCQEGQEDRFQGAQALSTQRKGRRTAVLGSGITDGGDNTGIRALFMQGGVGSASRLQAGAPFVVCWWVCALNGGPGEPASFGGAGVRCLCGLHVGVCRMHTCFVTEGPMSALARSQRVCPALTLGVTACESTTHRESG